ncbi:transcription termination/antitermination protein NusG [Methylosinus sp. Ce-a6]|uniref:transcription termination/antitermination protein NusG n=1 Tax=Methylosinus sp. Ce-a6 TaxID=2172005 RepID=UPI0013597E04|nr:transcription termination/antitermination NusG family protein [Methylosinus sp. Ce-a6]
MKEIGVASIQSDLPHVEQWICRRQDLILKDTERWYVAQSLPRQEPRAEFHLRRQGLRAFLPRMTKTVRHARKLRTVNTVVFPGYIFVILDIGRDRWRSVNGTFGVAGLIMAGETPRPAPSEVVEELLDIADEQGVLRFGDKLREGQTVRVTVGPFAGAVGCLERLDSKGRVRVLLDMMGGKVPMELDRSTFEAVGETSPPPSPPRATLRAHSPVLLSPGGGNG